MRVFQMVFVSSTMKEKFCSLMFPYYLMKNCSIEQPVFAANYIQGLIKAEAGGTPLYPACTCCLSFIVSCLAHARVCVCVCVCVSLSLSQVDGKVRPTSRCVSPAEEPLNWDNTSSNWPPMVRKHVTVSLIHPITESLIHPITETLSQ